MSNLLIHEPPLEVLPSLAKAIGLNESIVLQQIHYWLNNPKVGKDHEGRRWVYNSIREWRENNFPFWSIDTIKRTLASLRDQGLVLVAVLNELPRDRTLWYTIDYDRLAQVEFSIGAKSTNAEVQDAPMDEGKMHQPLPETTTERKDQSAREPVVTPTLPGANIDDYDDELIDMETALGQVVREVITYGPGRDKIREAAKALLSMGSTPSLVKQHFGKGGWWYEHNPFGKKDEKPWSSNVVNLMAQAMAWQPTAQANGNGKRSLEQTWAMVKLWRAGQGDLSFASPEVKRAINRLGEGNLKSANDWQMDHTYWPQFKAMVQAQGQPS